MSETPDLRDQIQAVINEKPVVLFMKGTADAPACGFSARTVAALRTLGQTFTAVNVLPDPQIRQELSAISGWPTIPQLFVRGELVGGCDIVMEMMESGDLERMLGVEGSEPVEGQVAATPAAAPLAIENRLG